MRPPPPPSLKTPPRPWPMRYVVIAIAVFIAVATYVNVRYRKPGPEFEPYHDIRARAEVERLLAMGFQRIDLPVERPADPLPAAQVAPAPARTAAAPGGLIADLRESLFDEPALPASYTAVLAAGEAAAGRDYLVQFDCHLPNDKEQVHAARLYRRGEHLYFVPDFERVPGALLTRSRESVVLLTVPSGQLKPGRYQATLVGAQASRAWTLTVR